MSQQNKISFSLSDAERKEIQNHIQALMDKLAPLLIQLSREERKKLPKMGDKTVAFVQKALDYSRQNPELAPAYLDEKEYAKDMAAVDQLKQILRPLEKLTGLLSDSAMLSGSEAYQAGLYYYYGVKGAAKANVKGAQDIYDDLASRFPGSGE